jgi:6,7-dimethyl-8-ribityllumazine synthase
MEPIRGQMNGAGKRFVVIVSRWNELVTKELLEGALEALQQHGNPSVDVVQVPGTWEIPVAARAALKNRPDGIVALGCILQGQTTHAQLLSGDVSSALMSLQVETGIPIAWGILTPDTPEQALDRAGMKHGNKGREAALAALEMANLVAALS